MYKSAIPHFTIEAEVESFSTLYSGKIILRKQLIAAILLVVTHVKNSIPSKKRTLQSFTFAE